MAEEKKHLILDWHFDCNTQQLKCELADGECVYIAHEGGNKGYTKIFNDAETFIEDVDWPMEKEWISEQYGELYGYYQPDDTRIGDDNTKRQEGLGPNGEYLDHLQRISQQLLGYQMSEIVDYSNSDLYDSNNGNPIPMFLTPDKGLTVYKLLPTNDTYYNRNYNKEAEDGVWYMVPQPCAMQPRSKGYVLSSYDEMLLAGLSESIVERCKAGEWEEPRCPQYLKNFTLPLENQVPLTAENLHKIY